MRLEKKNITYEQNCKKRNSYFFVSREERIMDADNEIENIINQKRNSYNRWRCYKRKSDYGKRNN